MTQKVCTSVLEANPGEKLCMDELGRVGRAELEGGGAGLESLGVEFEMVWFSSTNREQRATGATHRD